MDASDYSHIANITLDKNIYDLAVEVPLWGRGSIQLAPENYIAVVENAITDNRDSIVRLYEIGKTPSPLTPTTTTTTTTTTTNRPTTL